MPITIEGEYRKIKMKIKKKRLKNIGTKINEVLILREERKTQKKKKKGKRDTQTTVIMFSTEWLDLVRYTPMLSIIQ